VAGAFGEIVFRASAAAARHGASVERDTAEARVAYAAVARPARRPVDIAG
jgi:hypothetical protein